MTRVVFRNIVLTVVLAAIFTFSQRPDDKLHIIFCDVGQGDASLIVMGDFRMLIDVGPKNGGVLNCLSRHIPFWDKKLSVIVITHEQADHEGALDQVKKHYSIDKEYRANMIVGDMLRYANLRFDVIWPMENSDGPAANDEAVVGKLVFGGFRALFTADIDAKAELAIEGGGLLGKVNLLKVAHHGSKFGSSENFLAMIKPDVAVVSVGKNNSYGHPTKETLLRFDMVGSSLWRTDKNGEVEVVSDGSKYWVKAER